MNKIGNFIEFNGKKILYTSIDGTYWISVKSVCAALNVNYIRQYQNIQSDPILGPALSKQPIHTSGKQSRHMACLPEHLIYGWVFSIRSASEELQLYKRECYDILYQHFHGKMNDRLRLYSEIAETKKKIRKLENQLAQDPAYVEWQECRMELARKWKRFRTAEEARQDLFD